jgi:ABC-type nitrate/sulfonate/bicarbonate transport system substrate-binding protein
MKNVKISLLRGICQMPAYAAYEKGFFEQEGLAANLAIEPTASMVPPKLENGESHFAVIPWTRVAAAKEKGKSLVLLCGSGIEEAAFVIRKGIKPPQVKRVAVPLRGGIKDITAMGFIERAGFNNPELLRMPSGDGAIISLFGRGADAASMVEPYATMLEQMDIASVLVRTGDLWKGAPGCSLAATAQLKKAQPLLVQKVVTAFVRGAAFVRKNHIESADIASRYIGINPGFIKEALKVNQPDVNAIRNTQAMENVLAFMVKLGYINRHPKNYTDLTFLDKASRILGE